MIEDLVKRFYADLWEAGDEAAAPDILHPNLTFRGSVGQEKNGIPGYLEYLRFIRGALSEYRCDILTLVSDGAHAAAKMRFRGQHTGAFLGHAPTGTEIAWHGAAFFQMRDNRLADIWVLGDTEALHKALRAS